MLPGGERGAIIKNTGGSVGTSRDSGPPPRPSRPAGAEKPPRAFPSVVPQFKPGHAGVIWGEIKPHFSSLEVLIWDGITEKKSFWKRLCRVAPRALVRVSQSPSCLNTEPNYKLKEP